MADKAITELVAAEDITATDLFVLQQNDTAKKLPGQVLLNWLTRAADGHGGIKSIEKLKTNVLADTYRITLADTTIFDFVVNNGRGINTIEKVSSSGLVDTYQIRYNDNSTGTFTVTNGEKGDKGDRADIWVKYASQKPTASSHSFGDVPDSWIGIATGHNMAAAPTDWQQYTWFQWKGEKGDTGEPATLVSSQVTYQVGDSGTIIPSGSWTTSVPSVPPGKFLWTRQVLQFNTGAPITSYSVSRYGIDGSGAVSSVAGVAPDINGNVPLDASSLKALSIGGGTMEGPVNMNGQKLHGLNTPTADNDAVNKAYVDTNKVDKSKVVNGFDTTEEGFVADARALKVLHDSKMSMELLWQNGRPNNDFPEQSIALDLSTYDAIAIEARMQSDTYYDIFKSAETLCFIGHTAIIFTVYDNSDGSGVSYRVVSASRDTVTFRHGHGDEGEVSNNFSVPTHIYGIKFFGGAFT